MKEMKKSNQAGYFKRASDFFLEIDIFKLFV